MQMIVGVYRFIIAVFFVIALGVSAYVITSGIFAESGLGILGILGGFTMFFLIVLAIGATATFISIHDRISELVDVVANRNSVPGDIDA